MKYFKRKEFQCKCCGLDNMQKDTLLMLDKARGLSGIAFNITSGTRCEECNLKAGGKTDSAHLRGYAADIKCEDSRSRALIIGGLVEAGFSRIGIHPKFIHADNCPNKVEAVFWLY